MSYTEKQQGTTAMCQNIKRSEQSTNILYQNNKLCMRAHSMLFTDKQKQAVSRKKSNETEHIANWQATAVPMDPWYHWPSQGQQHAKETWSVEAPCPCQQESRSECTAMLYLS